METLDEKVTYEEAQKRILDILKSMVGKWSMYQLWRDFLTLAAYAISNRVDKQQYQRREELYMKTVEKYKSEEAVKFSKMLNLVSMGLTDKTGDFLGELYMQLEISNKDVGQFFSPYSISRLMARFLEVETSGELIRLHEPSCGSGGTIIAYAEDLKKQEINYQEKLRVICNDLDYDVVKMAYIQMSLLGIDAIVMQGDTLTQEYNETWYTPMHFINLRRLKQEKKIDKNANAKRMIDIVRNLEEREVKAAAVSRVEAGQSTIFDFL